jgi:hypothetical protein
MFSHPLTRVPPIEQLRPCREIATRDFIMYEFHNSGNSDMPNPDSSRSSDTCPRDERLGSHREIADRNFLLHHFFTLENSDIPICDFRPIPDTCPACWTAQILSGFSTNFFFLISRPRKRRFPNAPTPMALITATCPPQWTVQI